MNERKLTKQQILSFHQYLIQEEKSTATVEKYLRDVRTFTVYIGDSVVTKERVMNYKKHLLSENYAARSINSIDIPPSFGNGCRRLRKAHTKVVSPDGR